MTAGRPVHDPTAPVLSARRLQRSFGAVVAAADIDMDVAAGERLCLIGSNGAGKTTFVNMVTGYLKPSSGSILLAGEDITQRSPREITRRGVARSFQIPQLCLHMTVLENMLVALHCSRAPPTSCGRRATPNRWSAATNCSPASRWRRMRRGRCWSCRAACASCWTSPWR
jgi:ABC-type branched-subunit amino acid transport system ATPase component